ncbi:Kelch repeat-containing protein [Leptospira interrogans]|uniref:Kelch repeat-containing protein n=1 Tax=Leptospira interrogans TaxID=173 RepID=UPI0007740C80|nr:kelch repeat-containing protein [Leptospira interrogans]
MKKLHNLLISIIVLLNCNTTNKNDDWKYLLITLTQYGVDRYNHQATLLTDGKVLISGGNLFTGISPPASNNLFVYNSNNNLFESYSPMKHIRSSHRAIKLENNDVLIIGGYSGENVNQTVTNSAEVFQVSNNIIGIESNLNFSRYQFDVIALSATDYLVCGGFNIGEPVLNCEKYNISTNIWTIAGTLGYSRKWTTGFQISPTQILYCGGNIAPNCELYNTANNAVTIAASLNTARFNSLSIRYNSSKIIYIGGRTKSTNLDSLNTTEIFDINTLSISYGPSLPYGIFESSGVLLNDGRVLISGGTDSNGKFLSSLLVFNPVTNSISKIGEMKVSRSKHTLTLLQNGNVLIAGGLTEIGNSKYAEIFDPTTNSTTLIPDPMP